MSQSDVKVERYHVWQFLPFIDGGGCWSCSECGMRHEDYVPVSACLAHPPAPAEVPEIPQEAIPGDVEAAWQQAVEQHGAGSDNHTERALFDMGWDAAAKAILALEQRCCDLQAREAALMEHVSFQADHVENRIKDGIEMGASVWRIALEDVVTDNRKLLNEEQPRCDGVKS